MLNKVTNFYIEFLATLPYGVSPDIDVATVSIPQEFKTSNDLFLNSKVKSILTTRGVSTPTNGLVSVSNNTTVKEIITNPGTDTEKRRWEVSGIIPYNKSVPIARVTVTPAAGSDPRYYIPTHPGIELNTSAVDRVSNSFSNLNYYIKNVSITGTSYGGNTYRQNYVFDIYYSNSVATYVSDGIVFDFNINHQSLIRNVATIKAVNFGRDKIGIQGGTRNIKVVGAVGTRFNLSVINEDEDSILSPANANSTLVNRSGATIDCISDVIRSNGIYSFKQIFPNFPTVLTTKVSGSGAASGATTVTFDSLLGVNAGDQLVMKEITSPTVVKVISVDGNDATLTSSITAADDADAVFKRGTSYGINITSADTLGSDIPTTDPTYTISQPLYPTLTLKAITASRGYSINGKAIPGSGGQFFEQHYVGRTNRTRDQLIDIDDVTKRATVTYTLDKTGSHAFSLITSGDIVDGVPIFNRDASKSTWKKYYRDTNTTSENWIQITDDKDDNETSINITSIGTVRSTSGDGHANGVCTITFTVDIETWREKDIMYELDLDSLVS